MKKYKRGIFIGKFYPLHFGHISSIITLANLCEAAYLVFYNDSNAEKKLAGEFGRNYTIGTRIADAKKVLSHIDNIHIVQVTIPPNITFPRNYEKIKKLVEEQVGGVCDLQIFGSEEKDIYVPYKYASDYTLGSMYIIENNESLTSLHATLIRSDYEYYKKYLPTLIQQTIDTLDEK